jgi:hypothetical protein
MQKVLFIGVAALLWGGCYYDVEEELYPSSGVACDTAGVTYAGQIEPLLSAHCYTCHSAASALGNVVLEGYQNTMIYAGDGRLLGSVSHEPGYAAMPQGGNKLSNCNIEIIKHWIQTGSPEN